MYFQTQMCIYHTEDRGDDRIAFLSVSESTRNPTMSRQTPEYAWYMKIIIIDVIVRIWLFVRTLHLLKVSFLIHVGLQCMKQVKIEVVNYFFFLPLLLFFLCFGVAS